MIPMLKSLGLLGTFSSCNPIRLTLMFLDRARLSESKNIKFNWFSYPQCTEPVELDVFWRSVTSCDPISTISIVLDWPHRIWSTYVQFNRFIYLQGTEQVELGLDHAHWSVFRRSVTSCDPISTILIVLDRSHRVLSTHIEFNRFIHFQDTEPVELGVFRL